jgi:diguanylate cyclase (GGDEF)-like protein
MRCRAVTLAAACAVIGLALLTAPHRVTAPGVLLAGVLLAGYSWLLIRGAHGRSAEQKLELAQSRALIEVSRALSGTRSVDETLELVTGWAARLVGGHAAVLELLTDDDLLEVRAVEGMSSDLVGLRFPVEGSFTGWVVRYGTARCTRDASRESLVCRGAAPYLGASAVAAVPLLGQGGTLGVLSCIGPQPFETSDVELLSAFASHATIAIETARLFRCVEQLSVTDPLTGLANRRQLERDLNREFAAARRGRRLIAVMLDLNDFKEFNDRHGHVAGDEALRAFGAALAAETRRMNLAARYGGDEFIVLLADSDTAGATIFLQRVAERFPPPGSDPRLAEVSFSAGFAEYQPDMEDPLQLVEAADRALYRGKASRPFHVWADGCATST